MTSTYHTYDMHMPVSRGKGVIKPAVVSDCVDYNSHMGGVDLRYQMLLHTYCNERKVPSGM
jgi:hypothetical protein